jgi:hypothetical protein
MLLLLYNHSRRGLSTLLRKWGVGFGFNPLLNGGGFGFNPLLITPLHPSATHSHQGFQSGKELFLQCNKLKLLVKCFGFLLYEIMQLCCKHKRKMSKFVHNIVWQQHISS